MKTLKFELAITGAALFALGAFVAMQGADAGETPVAPVSKFSKGDFKAFDRDFTLNNESCSVGFLDHKLCLGSSPYEADLVIGGVLNPEIPILAAEFRVIVETDLKVESLRTVRFGQTLVLIDPETRKVEDLIRLSANSFDKARQPIVAPSES